MSVLLSPGLTWSLSGREAFARFASTLILIPTCLMFRMIAANYYGAEIPSAAPMGTIRALLLLTNIACLIVLRREMFACQAGLRSPVRSHATMYVAIIIAALLASVSGTMLPDVLAAMGIVYVNATRRSRLARCAAPATARIQFKTDVRSYRRRVG